MRGIILARAGLAGVGITLAKQWDYMPSVNHMPHAAKGRPDTTPSAAILAPSCSMCYNGSTMKRHLMTILGIIVCAAVLYGCGGSGIGTEPPPPPGDNPYAGHWEGSWADQLPVNGYGTAIMDITGGGHWSMSGTNDKLHSTFQGSGDITDDGKLSGTMTQNGNGLTGQVTGSLTMPTPSKIQGAVVITTNNGSSQVNVDLVK